MPCAPRKRAVGRRCAPRRCPWRTNCIADARYRKGVKQVSTLGPASATRDMIEKLFVAGTDVFRLNLSHGAADKLEAARHIREVEAKFGHPVGILADLQGPKRRVGMFSDELPKVFLEKGPTCWVRRQDAPRTARREYNYRTPRSSRP